MASDLGVCKAEKVHGMQVLATPGYGASDFRSHSDAVVGCIV